MNLRWTSKIGYVVIATIVLHGTLVAVFLRAYGGDLSALVCAAETRIGKAPYEAIRVGFPSGGYDGQFCYALARAPWKRHGEDIDGSVRQMRIGYPALCWALSGGHAQLLLWVMPLVNLAAVAGIAYLGACLALRWRRSAWWGLVLALAVNAGQATLRNLTDPLSTCAVLGLLAAWLTGERNWPLIVWAALALFSRELNAVIVGIVLLFAMWQRHRTAALGLAAVLALWFAWIGVLHSWYGTWPFMMGKGPLDWPFASMIDRWSHLGFRAASRYTPALHILFLSHLTLLVLCALAMLTVHRRVGVLSLTAVAGVLLVAVAGFSVYEDAWSYTRVFVWLPVSVFLLGMEGQYRWPLVVLTPAALFPWIAVIQAWRG